VQRNDAGTYVYAVQADQTVKLQPVEVAELQGARAVIAKGVQAGERVVADGQYKLKPGALIAEAPARPGAAPTGGRPPNPLPAPPCCRRQRHCRRAPVSLPMSHP
jgi:multidrug efflux system membrane fusion protein